MTHLERILDPAVRDWEKEYTTLCTCPRDFSDRERADLVGKMAVVVGEHYVLRKRRVRGAPPVRVGVAIREARDATGLSQLELAVLVGVAPSTVGGWERGRQRPGLENLKQLRDALGDSIPV